MAESGRAAAGCPLSGSAGAGPRRSAGRKRRPAGRSRAHAGRARGLARSVPACWGPSRRAGARGNPRPLRRSPCVIPAKAGIHGHAVSCPPFAGLTGIAPDEGTQYVMPAQAGIRPVAAPPGASPGPCDPAARRQTRPEPPRLRAPTETRPQKHRRPSPARLIAPKTAVCDYASGPGAHEPSLRLTPSRSKRESRRLSSQAARGFTGRQPNREIRFPSRGASSTKGSAARSGRAPGWRSFRAGR